MTDDMKTALAALLDDVESVVIEHDGAKWGTVYLDNARPKDWNARKWAGILGALTKAGLYKDFDDRQFKGIFGEVKMI